MKNAKLINWGPIIVAIISVFVIIAIAGLWIMWLLQPASTTKSSTAATYSLRYFDSVTNNNSDDNEQDYKIGYTDNNGNAHVITRDDGHVAESITDTNKFTVTTGNIAHVTRAPYQSFDAGEKSSKVTVIGWSDFIKAHPNAKNSTVKVKWFDSVMTADMDNSITPVIEFAYNGHLYRIYMPSESLGHQYFTESISMSVDTPSLTFNKQGHMTYTRAPYNSYVQASKAGTVIGK